MTFKIFQASFPLLAFSIYFKLQNRPKVLRPFTLHSHVMRACNFSFSFLIKIIYKMIRKNAFFSFWKVSIVSLSFSYQLKFVLISPTYFFSSSSHIAFVQRISSISSLFHVHCEQSVFGKNFKKRFCSIIEGISD